MYEDTKNDSYSENALDWTSHKRSGRKIRHEYLEKPAIYAKVPNVQNASVLCIGCGSGEECQFLKEKGALRVVGIDSAKGLIEQAKYSYPDVEFLHMDMQKLDFEPESFDFVFSSLALHYVEDLKGLFEKVNKVLKPSGLFLFSTHHPVRWGAESMKKGKERSYLLGYSKHEDDSYTIYGDYFTPRKITDTWFEQLDVTYYHKPISEIFQSALSSGFEIIDFLEPKPIPATKGEREDIWDIHNKIPLFMILELKKK
jgi:SAM-dependent methyltransferase